MKDLCATCDIAEKDYDPSDPEYFCCSDAEYTGKGKGGGIT